MKIKLMILFLLAIITPVCCFAADEIIVTAPASSSALIKFTEPLTASFTAEQLFDRMEKKSETINAIESDVELTDTVGTSAVILRIKSPDKFSITFNDGTAAIYFNGSTLWVYIKSINECFFHNQEKMSFWEKWSSFSAWFNPKKIFLNMTRTTLNALFDIKSIKREKTTDGDYHYYVKMTPKMKDIFIQVFELGYYEIIFSEKTYLPIKVMEYSPNGKLKTTLYVKSYKMNCEVPDELFNYNNTTNATVVPISIVILQKFEEYKDNLMKKIDKAKESAINSILNWSF